MANLYIISGTSSADWLTGSYFIDDRIYAGSGNDYLFGYSGNDRLFGEDGDDRLYGGSGNDSLDGSSGADYLSGGLGTDTASYRYSAAGVIVDLLANYGFYGDADGDTFYSIENLTGSDHDDSLAGTDGDNVINGLGGSDAIFGYGGNDTLIGGYGDDYIWGGVGDDLIDGGGNHDTLVGGDGNDTFVSGNGYDQHYGGNGIDTITFAGSGYGIVVNLGRGTGWHGDASGDGYFGIENLIGTAYRDVIYGSDATNVIDTGGGNDDILDYDGDNTIYAGTGDDRIYAGSGGDDYYGGDGIDTVDFGPSDSGVHVNLLSGEGTAGYAAGDTYAGIENVSGSRYDDIIHGDDAGNVLSGKHGDDYLRGRGGDDVIEGGAGADQLVGDAGSDTASYQHSYIRAGVDVSLNDNTAHGGDAEGDFFISIENLTGSEYDDRLEGTDGDNVIKGLGGEDRLYGEAGNDMLEGGRDHDRLYGGAGNDTLNGGDGRDFIFGGDGADVLNGGDGNDRLWARDGADILNGGKGYDTAYFSSKSKLIIDLTNGTTSEGDTLISIENVRVGNSSELHVTGDDNDNGIYATFGDGTLFGMGGDDYIEGSLGNDIIHGGAGDDTLWGDRINGGNDYPDEKHYDTFVFVHHGYGENDVIADFEIGYDQIDLSDTEVTGWDDLNRATDNDFFEQVGDDVVIHTSHNDTITLQHIQRSDLSEFDFVF